MSDLVSAKYRPEIDGLRALAVLPVILFHAGVPWFPGGFPGVDIFFVISGYLITRIIAYEIEIGNFSIAKFYERRARRILPALVLVMLTTIPFAILWMPPEALASYFRSLGAAALFYSNIHFWMASDYFRPDADEQPLLHTWSLSVEEQYYIIFPLLLFVTMKWLRRPVAAPIVLSVTSIVTTILHMMSDQQSIAFYFLHARAWELLTGSLLAIVERRKLQLPQHQTARSIVALGGMAMIIVPILLHQPQWATPGWPNLCVVAGTAMIIHAASAITIAGQWLAWKPLVAIGLISYSAYLWHHPLFAFVRLRSMNEPPLWLFLTLAVVALLLAWISWRFVERPFRNRAFLSRTSALTISAATVSALGAFAAAAIWLNLQTARLTKDTMAFVEPPISKVEHCKWLQPVDGQSKIELCPMGIKGKSKPVLLWGDSHAAALFDALSDTLAKQDQSGFYLKNYRCMRIPGIVAAEHRSDAELASCNTMQTRFMEHLAQNPPRAIVLHFRWTLRLFPVSDAGQSVGFDNGEGGIEGEDLRINWIKDENGQWSTADTPKSTAIKAFVEKLSLIAPVVLVGPVPEVGWHVGNRNFRAMVINGQSAPDITTDANTFLKRNKVALDSLNQITAQPNVRRVEPSEIFCNSWIAGRCVAQHAGVPYYADDDHVSYAGASLIVEQIMKHLPVN
jgi:peptidoglycan/LPS O-acetylase OafA/YrhL